MSISLSAISSIFIEFVNENLIPFIDKTNASHLVCIEKWQQFVEKILKKISNFNSEQDLRERVKVIVEKKSKKQKTDKLIEQKTESQLGQKTLSIRVKFAQEQKLKLAMQQDPLSIQKTQAKQRQQTVQFRDRKTSLDEFSNRKDRKQHSQIILRKDERSGSVNLNSGLDGDYATQIPLIITPGQYPEKHRNSSYVRKDNEVLSFNSISDFHKSRNNIPATKQVKQPELAEIKLMSKKSIQDYVPTSLVQNKPNSYSSNYIESIKKISLESRSPNEKSRLHHQQLQGAQDYVQTTPVKLLEGTQIAGGSTISNIKKKISQGSDYVSSPPLGPSDSFGKFLNSFKKLCNTFESNHNKLMREDFNNKYINC